MKIIFSNLCVERFKKNLNTEKLSLNLEMAKLSNFLVQSHGYKTCFCGDKESLHLFSGINFNEFIELDEDRIYDIPTQIWSIGKLFSMLKIEEPFIHMDYDIFLFKKFDDNFFKNEIIYYHNEFYIDKYVDEYQSYFNLNPIKNNNFINRSYNCALFGGQNFKLIHNICNQIIDFIMNHKEEINKVLKSDRSSSFESFWPAVLVEQVWIFQLLKHYKQKFVPYLHETINIDMVSKEAYVKNICHLQGSKSNNLISKNIFSINKYLDI
jgi:hypothetical protein